MQYVVADLFSGEWLLKKSTTYAWIHGNCTYMYFYLHKYWPGLRFSEMICKRGTTVSLTVEQDTLQNELKDTWPSELIPHICFISLYPSQIPSNWFWIVIFILNKLPLLIVKVHCATQFSYRANDRKGAWGGGGERKKNHK